MSLLSYNACSTEIIAAAQTFARTAQALPALLIALLPDPTAPVAELVSRFFGNLTQVGIILAQSPQCLCKVPREVLNLVRTIAQGFYYAFPTGGLIPVGVTDAFLALVTSSTRLLQLQQQCCCSKSCFSKNFPSYCSTIPQDQCRCICAAVLAAVGELVNLIGGALKFFASTVPDRLPLSVLGDNVLALGTAILESNNVNGGSTPPTSSTSGQNCCRLPAIVIAAIAALTAALTQFSITPIGNAIAALPRLLILLTSLNSGLVYITADNSDATCGCVAPGNQCVCQAAQSLFLAIEAFRNSGIFTAPQPPLVIV